MSSQVPCSFLVWLCTLHDKILNLKATISNIYSNFDKDESTPNSQLDTYHRSGLWQGSRPVQNIKWPGRKWKCPNAGLWTHSSEFTQGNPIAVYVFVYFLISKWSPVARSLLSGLTPYSPHLLPPTGIKL